MLTDLDRRIFLAVNAPAHPAPAFAMFADFAANWLVYAVMLLMVMLWVWGGRPRRGPLLATAAGAAAAVGVNQMLGMLWYEPRPFAAGIGHTLIAHAADNSFPSDHATFIWSIGFGLAATGAGRRPAIAACLVGLLVAWARVFVGVHFPVDMVVSLLVALLAAGLARLLTPAIARWALPVVEPVYLGSLRAMHLPNSLFPREAPLPATRARPWA